MTYQHSWGMVMCMSYLCFIVCLFFMFMTYALRFSFTESYNMDTCVSLGFFNGHRVTGFVSLSPIHVAIMCSSRGCL